MAADNDNDDPTEPKDTDSMLIHQLGALKVYETGEETAAGGVLKFVQVTGNPPYMTLVALRDYAISLQPSHIDDLDHLIAQLQEQPNEYIRAIGSDPLKSCEGLGIQCGQVEPVTVVALAKGLLEDRERDSNRGFKLWQMVLTGVVTLVTTLVVVAVSAS